MSKINEITACIDKSNKKLDWLGITIKENNPYNNGYIHEVCYKLIVWNNHIKSLLDKLTDTPKK